MKKIAEKDRHDIQLKSIRIVSLTSFVNTDLHEVNEESINVETSVGSFGEILTDIKGKTYLKTKIQGLREDETVFEIEVVYEGICESEKPVDEKEFEFFLEVQSIPMLWSYCRETINNTMLKMNLKPILLPALNITKIMNDIRKSKEGDGGEVSDN